MTSGDLLPSEPDATEVVEATRPDGSALTEPVPHRGVPNLSRLLVSTRDGRWVFGHGDDVYRIRPDQALRLVDRVAVYVLPTVSSPRGSVPRVRSVDGSVEVTLLDDAGSRRAFIDDDPYSIVAPIWISPSPWADGWLPTTFTVSCDGAESISLHFYLPVIEANGPKHCRLVHHGCEIATGEVVRGDETTIPVPVADLGPAPCSFTVEIDRSEPAAAGDERPRGVVLSAVTRVPEDTEP